MKKYKKILFGVMAALVLCVTSVNFSEASVKTDQKNAIKAYRSLVQDGSCYYKIVDINGDNVKDLLLMDKSYEYAEVGYYKVYTYRNGKLKCLKKFDYCRGGNLYYNTKKHMVIMVRGLFGGRETYVYTAQKNSLKKSIETCMRKTKPFFLRTAGVMVLRVGLNDLELLILQP